MRGKYLANKETSKYLRANRATAFSLSWFSFEPLLNRLAGESLLHRMGDYFADLIVNYSMLIWIIEIVLQLFSATSLETMAISHAGALLVLAVIVISFKLSQNILQSKWFKGCSAWSKGLISTLVVASLLSVLIVPSALLLGMVNLPWLTVATGVIGLSLLSGVLTVWQAKINKSDWFLNRGRLSKFIIASLSAGLSVAVVAIPTVLGLGLANPPWLIIASCIAGAGLVLGVLKALSSNNDGEVKRFMRSKLVHFAEVMSLVAGLSYSGLYLGVVLLDLNFIFLFVMMTMLMVLTFALKIGVKHQIFKNEVSASVSPLSLKSINYIRAAIGAVFMSALMASLVLVLVQTWPWLMAAGWFVSLVSSAVMIVAILGVLAPLLSKNMTELFANIGVAFKWLSPSITCIFLCKYLIALAGKMAFMSPALFVITNVVFIAITMTFLIVFVGAALTDMHHQLDQKKGGEDLNVISAYDPAPAALISKPDSNIKNMDDIKPSDMTRQQKIDIINKFGIDEASQDSNRFGYSGPKLASHHRKNIIKIFKKAIDEGQFLAARCLYVSARQFDSEGELEREIRDLQDYGYIRLQVCSQESNLVCAVLWRQFQDANFARPIPLHEGDLDDWQNNNVAINSVARVAPEPVITKTPAAIEWIKQACQATLQLPITSNKDSSNSLTFKAG